MSRQDRRQRNKVNRRCLALSVMIVGKYDRLKNRINTEQRRYEEHNAFPVFPRVRVVACRGGGYVLRKLLRSWCPALPALRRSSENICWKLNFQVGLAFLGCASHANLKFVRLLARRREAKRQFRIQTTLPWYMAKFKLPAIRMLLETFSFS